MIPVNKARSVIISGLTSAGKTTHSKLLAQEYGLQYVSASTILLKLAGLPLEQPLDFWITSQGLQLSKNISWKEIDDECRRAEAAGDKTVFDTWSMPWIHSRSCMVIWIDSSLESRVMKAHISHEGQSKLTQADLEQNLKAKDAFAREQIINNYGIDLLQDRTPFNLIVDISNFIAAPTRTSSIISIKNAHEIISSAVGWYLYEDQKCREKLLNCVSKYGNQIIPRHPVDTLDAS
jgi:cytidylate kinase